MIPSTWQTRTNKYIPGVLSTLHASIGRRQDTVYNIKKNSPRVYRILAYYVVTAVTHQFFAQVLLAILEPDSLCCSKLLLSCFALLI